MDIKKLTPWDWFKKENEQNGHTIPVKYSNKSGNRYSPVSFGGLHNEMDRLFDGFFNEFALSPFRSRSLYHYPKDGNSKKQGETDRNKIYLTS